MWRYMRILLVEDEKTPPPTCARGLPSTASWSVCGLRVLTRPVTAEYNVTILDVSLHGRSEDRVKGLDLHRCSACGHLRRMRYFSPPKILSTIRLPRLLHRAAERPAGGGRALDEWQRLVVAAEIRQGLREIVQRDDRGRRAAHRVAQH